MEVVLHSYQKAFPKIFIGAQKQLKTVLPANTEIHHIGSTAVPGLGGKGMIDIMIALPNWRQEEKIISLLTGAGYKHLHPRYRGRIFMSPDAETHFKDIHLHIVLKGSADYKKLLFFRDVLRRNQKLVQEYQKIKNDLLKLKIPRAEYTKRKSLFIENIIKQQ